MSESVKIMMPVKVAAVFCDKCPEMELLHRADVCVVPDAEGRHLETKQTIECKHLFKCLNILETAKRYEDEPRE